MESDARVITHLQSPTIDQDEVSFYHQLAETWWQLDGPFWPLHRLNTLRLSWILAKAEGYGFCSKPGLPLKGVRVLDIGCGGGILSEGLATLGAEVTAVDVVERNIRIAKLHNTTSSFDIDFRWQSAEQLLQTGAEFDIVFNMEVVEHVADVSLFLEQCNALVRPGGLQFVASINKNWVAYLVAILGAEYLLKWLPKGTHQYRKLVPPKQVIKALRAGGFIDFSQTGVAVNPFSRQMALVTPTWVNYMMVAQKEPAI